MSGEKQSVEASVTWAWPVDVTTLGAHLEAYVKLQPTILTLRLCNRFGQGPDAVITNLPVELIGHIESYLIRDEYRKTRLAWRKDYKCYSMQCEPIDHFAPWTRQQMYQQMFPEEFVHSDSDDPDAVPFSPLKKVEIAKLAKLIKDDYEYADGWAVKHEERRDAWHGRVGAPASQDCGVFTTQKDFVLKVFGLQIWISHERGHKNDKDDTLTRSTQAYLTLPHAATASREWYERIEEDDFPFIYGEPDFGGWSTQKTQSCLAAPIILPRPLSDKSRLRWPRAMKMLGLLGLHTPTGATQPSLYASKEDGEGHEIETKESTSSDVGGKTCWPSLMLLVKCKDHIDS